MTTLFKRLLPLLLILLSTATSAHPRSIDLDNVDLRSALRILAKWIHRDVVLSPAIEGNITLHFHDAPLPEVFDFLLKTQGLQAWQTGPIWYISPKDAAIKQKQEEAKWRDLMEEAAPQVIRLWQIHYAKAEELAHWLQAGPPSLLSKQGQVHADLRTNMLCVKDTEERVTAIHPLIESLDQPLKQVRIEARLVSVDRDYEQELGFRFLSVNDNGDTKESHWEAPRNLGQYSLLIAHLADNSLLDVKLAAMENQGHGELISSPSLFTANQQTASIEAGEEIPYQEASSSGATAVVFKKAVLSLKVKPAVLPGKKVLLQLQINQDRPNARLVLGVPSITTRQLISSVLVPSGQTVVLGGIYEQTQETNNQGLPFLSKIPLLGWLFQVNNLRKSKRELLVFVTPRVIE